MAPPDPGLSKPERLQDLFKYYIAAFKATFGNFPGAQEVQECYDPTSARLSNDPILNALAQLAALKTGTERCFINLIDDTHQIIIAEATKSISLFDASHDPKCGGLLLGATLLDLVYGVCAGTIPAFLDGYDSDKFIDTANIYADRTRYIIRDFSKEPMYRDRPYVTGFPYFRFYAEVPIKTPQGSVIGSLAVVDNEPRKFLEDEHYRSLCEVASTIMNHLAMIKTDSDHLRANSLLDGLTTYVGSTENRGMNQAYIPGLPPALPSIDGTPSPYAKQDPATNGHKEAKVPTSTKGRTAAAYSGSVSGGDTSNAFISAQVRDSFSTAAVVLRDAMDLDGVNFFDVSNPGGPDRSNRQNKWHGDLQQDASSLLGSSSRIQDHEKHSRTASDSVLPEAIRLSIMQMYPTGCVFDMTQEDKLVALPLSPPTSFPRRARSFAWQSRGTSTSDDIVAAIRSTYPGVQSAIFYPLWSPSRQTWVAGSFGWTKSYRRLLQPYEHSYWSIFCNCVLTEISVLDLEAKDQAKSDFISSISHEIRSPIHGILGNAELANDHTQDNYLSEHISAIKECGHTLLDTIDHILDYAKITTATTKGLGLFEGTDPSLNNGEQGITTFELDEVVENTVSTLIQGHRFHQKSDRQLIHGNSQSSYGLMVEDGGQEMTRNSLADLIVLVNIAKPGIWRVKSSMVSWRRIILNLVGNSLKYTETGLIEVSLDLDKSSNEVGGGHRAVLTVRDTGCGMSRDFLQNYLFTPFRQENGLSVGTGLGLSIVKRVVEDIHGTINVQSEVNVGTQVTIVQPVGLDLSLKPEPKSGVSGTIVFMGFEPLVTHDGSYNAPPPRMRGLAAVKGVVKQCVEKWCGLEEISLSEHEKSPANVIAIDESTFETFDHKSDSTFPANSGLLVVSTSCGPVEKRLKMADNDKIQHVACPLAPRRISQAVNRLLSRTTNTNLLRAAGVATGTPLSLRSAVNQESGRSIKPSDGSGGTFRGTTASNEQTRDGPRLLLVDDNKINIDMLAAQARKLKCPYVTAMNGQEALDRFKASQEAFAFIFMDLSMPVMDGFEATRAIRAFERETKRVPTPVVALTGLSSAESQQRALHSGCNMFLTKPVSVKKIAKLIEGSALDVGSG